MSVAAGSRFSVGGDVDCVAFDLLRAFPLRSIARSSITAKSSRSHAADGDSAKPRMLMRHCFDGRAHSSAHWLPDAAVNLLEEAEGGLARSKLNNLWLISDLLRQRPQLWNSLLYSSFILFLWSRVEGMKGVERMEGKIVSPAMRLGPKLMGSDTAPFLSHSLHPSTLAPGFSPHLGIIGHFTEPYRCDQASRASFSGGNVQPLPMLVRYFVQTTPMLSSSTRKLRSPTSGVNPCNRGARAPSVINQDSS